MAHGTSAHCDGHNVIVYSGYTVYIAARQTLERKPGRNDNETTKQATGSGYRKGTQENWQVYLEST